MGAWQPIETAPKVRRVLLAGRDWATIGRWLDDRWWTESPYVGVRPMRSDGRGETPTHWMPLPQPPEVR